MLSEKQWAELAKRGEEIRSDGPGRRMVKAAQAAVKPIVIENEKLRDEFEKVRVPALALIGRIASIEPLTPSSSTLVQHIADLKGELNRLCHTSNFDRLLEFVAELSADQLQKTYKLGLSFDERVKAQVQNCRACVGRIVELTKALEGRMEEYYKRSGIMPASGAIPIHYPEDPDGQGGAENYDVITNIGEFGVRG